MVFYLVNDMERQNIISFSGGKDSTATVILAHEHNIKAKIVMAVLWFDKARGIPAIDVDHWNFIVNTIVPKFEEWGFEVEFVHAKRDYMQEFNAIAYRSKIPERNGKKRGFLLSGKCAMTHQKTNAIKKIQKKYKDCVSIQGIAIDEPERLVRMHIRGGRSLLEEYGYTEQMALDLCKKYGLLSPIYERTHRDGCWFCPNQKIKDLAYWRENHPYLWHELEILSKDENVIKNTFKYAYTFEDVNKKIDNYLEKERLKKNQLNIFDLIGE